MRFIVLALLVVSNMAYSMERGYFNGSHAISYQTFQAFKALVMSRMRSRTQPTPTVQPHPVIKGPFTLTQVPPLQLPQGIVESTR